MVNFPLRPLLLLRQPQLILCSSSLPLPPNNPVAVVAVQPSQDFSSYHSEAVRIPPSRFCPEKRSLHCRSLPIPQSRGRFLAVPFRGGAFAVGRRSLSWEGRRVAAGLKGSTGAELRIRFLGGYGYAQKGLDHHQVTVGRSGAAARKSSGGESVEYVEEDEDATEMNEHHAVLSDDDVSILTQYMTRHNFVRVLEVSRSADSVLAGARVLLLDKPGNVHSIYQKYKVLTEAYYDVLAALPAVIPEGPIGILGLGAGTAARLIHHFWPEIELHGWELDPGVVQAARNFFDLGELEWQEDSHLLEQESKAMAEEDAAVCRRPSRRRRNSSGSYGLWNDESDEVKLSLFRGMAASSVPRHRGRLRVHVGDALQLHQTSLDGLGFAGLIVDLFAEGAVIPALQQVETWRRMRENLKPGGRIMVNCGGSCVEAAAGGKDGGITMRETIAALAEAFPGELSITSLREQGDNSMALTGPPPDFQLWRDTLPECLRFGVEDWRPFPSNEN